MALFTIRLREVLDYTDDIGLNNYPIFDEEYREGLNSKIIEHYWNEEIGLETIDMFRFAMRRKMNEIMPYYNQLYESERLEYDPLLTVDMQTVTSETAVSEDDSASTGTSSDETTSTSSDETSTTNSTESGTRARSVSSDTPQTMLSGDADYASSASDTVSDTSGSGSQDSTTDGTASSESSGSTSDTTHAEGTLQRDGDETRKGREGMLGSEAILKYRESLLNIDLMVIEDLKDLFMLVWGYGDVYEDSYPFPQPGSVTLW